MASQETIKKCLRMLGVAYPGSSLDDATPQLYYRMLEDIPDEILEMAVLDHISKSPYYPRVSELRRAAATITTGASMLPDAMDEWGKVLAQIRNSGDPERLDNPITKRVVEAMDWYELRQSDNQAADRARFIEAYNEKKAGLITEAMTLPKIKELTTRALPAPVERNSYQEHIAMKARLGYAEDEPI